MLRATLLASALALLAVGSAFRTLDMEVDLTEASVSSSGGDDDPDDDSASAGGAGKKPAEKPLSAASLGFLLTQ